MYPFTSTLLHGLNIFCYNVSFYVIFVKIPYIRGRCQVIMEKVKPRWIHHWNFGMPKSSQLIIKISIMYYMRCSDCLESTLHGHHGHQCIVFFFSFIILCQATAAVCCLFIVLSTFTFKEEKCILNKCCHSEISTVSQIQM